MGAFGICPDGRAMRIVGGELRSRLIRVPKTRDLRPSTEKIRGAIFSVLGADIKGARVADLFCGSGALGLEALSRGASFALFVDSSGPAISIAKRNVLELDLSSRAELCAMNVFRLRPKKLEGISIIFADPPYGKGFGDRLISLLCLKKMATDGILVLEHEADWSYAAADLDILRRLDFGDSSVSFIKMPACVD